MSTFLDFAVKSRDDLKNYIWRKLGGKHVSVELDDDDYDDAINDAMEVFSKYIQYEREFYGIDLDNYIEGVGVLMPENVVGVFGISEYGLGTRGTNSDQIFAVPVQLANSGLLRPGGASGGWVTYELAMQYVDMIHRLTGKGIHFEYNPRTRLMKMYPDPIADHIAGTVVVNCNILRPEAQMHGEKWVKDYALASAMETLGRVRVKIKDTTLMGGGKIDTSVLDTGEKRKLELEKELQLNEGGAFQFFVM